LNAVFGRLAGNRVTIDVSMPLLLKYTPRFSEVVNHYAKDAGLIIISHPWVYPSINKRRDQVLIYDAQNCEYLVKKEILGRSLVARFLLRVVRNIEGKLCHASDLIFACSEEDKLRLTQIYGVEKNKIFVIPNGVDCGEIRPSSQAQKQSAKAAIGIKDKKTVLFVGSNYKPNTEATDFIVSVLAHELPGLQFLIIGGVGDTYLHSLKSSADLVPRNVRFFGTVDEEIRNTIYSASDIAINPMFSGSGTNIKMFDYMAAGIPVISTHRGARGIEAPSDTFIVCEAFEFAKNIQMVLCNPVLLHEMSKKAREFVEDKFDWGIIAKSAHSVIRSRLGTC
jgi:glycosyltransferase involved in cell wall biosynthesis